MWFSFCISWLTRPSPWPEWLICQNTDNVLVYVQFAALFFISAPIIQTDRMAGLFSCFSLLVTISSFTLEKLCYWVLFIDCLSGLLDMRGNSKEKIYWSFFCLTDAMRGRYTILQYSFNIHASTIIIFSDTYHMETWHKKHDTNDFILQVSSAIILVLWPFTYERISKLCHRLKLWLQ